MKKKSYYHFLILSLLCFGNLLILTSGFAQYLDMDGNFLEPEVKSKEQSITPTAREDSPPFQDLQANQIFQWMKASPISEDGSVDIRWKFHKQFIDNPEIDQYKLEIHRSRNEIMSKNNLNKNTLLVSLNSQETSFQDKLTQNGVYYYTLFVSKEKKLLPDGATIGINSIRVSQVNDIFLENPFLSLKAFPQKSQIHLTWSFSRGFKLSDSFREYQIKLYRFQNIPTSLNDIKEDNLIKIFSDEETSYNDIPDKFGLYHYAIFLLRNKKLYPKKLIPNINFLTNIQFQIKLLELSFENLKEILKKYYFKGNYKGTIQKLERYKKASDNKVKGMALFYIGLSFFKTEKFEEAMSYFSNTHVVQNDEVRAKFWQKRVDEETEEK